MGKIQWCAGTEGMDKIKDHNLERLKQKGFDFLSASTQSCSQASARTRPEGCPKITSHSTTSEQRGIVGVETVVLCWCVH